MKFRFEWLLFSGLAACLMLASGCDLGTYNKRLRSPGVPKPVETQPAETQPDDAGASNETPLQRASRRSV